MNCQLKNELSRSTCTMYDYHKALSACRSAAQTSQQHSVVPSVAKKRREDLLDPIIGFREPSDTFPVGLHVVFSSFHKK